jgi:hypothetical protein
MKKLLIVPLLLTVLLVGGCSLSNQAKAPASNNSTIDPIEEIVPEPAPEPMPVSEIPGQPAPDPQPLVVNPADSAVACTMDAQICPDGSAVGRVAPDCQFAPCPGQ